MTVSKVQHLKVKVTAMNDCMSAVSYFRNETEVSEQS
jgi:hypothetical protein